MEALVIILIIVVLWYLGRGCSEGFAEHAKNKNKAGANLIELQKQQQDCVSQGNTWTMDGCKTPQQICESQGKVWADNKCKTQQEACESQGKVWTENGCKTPQQICESQGKVWGDNKCKTPQEACKSQGNLWMGGTCVTKQQVCESQGEVWTGNACVTKQLSCKIQGKSWINDTCVDTRPNNCTSLGNIWVDSYNKCVTPITYCRNTNGQWETDKCNYRGNCTETQYGTVCSNIEQPYSESNMIGLNMIGSSIYNINREEL